MSQAIASARKRRGVPQQNPVPDVPQNRMNPSIQQQQSGQNMNTPGLTLPQVISVIDRRLTILENMHKVAIPIVLGIAFVYIFFKK